MHSAPKKSITNVNISSLILLSLVATVGSYSILTWPDPGLHSLSGKTFYQQISRNFQIWIYDFPIALKFERRTLKSVANFREIVSIQDKIWDFAIWAERWLTSQWIEAWPNPEGWWNIHVINDANASRVRLGSQDLILPYRAAPTQRHNPAVKAMTYADSFVPPVIQAVLNSTHSFDLISILF